MAVVPEFDDIRLSRALSRDLRSNHAGEAGAVAIYRGILSVTRDPELIAFARDHLATEQRHLDFFDLWLPRRWHSLALPLWKVSGFLLGALPALFGRRWAYGTISAVETFVVRHYQEQIDQLDPSNPDQAALASKLRDLQHDEHEHQQDAARRYQRPGLLIRSWQRVVGVGSAIAVKAARAIRTPH